MLDFRLRPFIPSDSSALARVWQASWLSTGVPVARDVRQEDLLERVRAELALGWRVTVAEVGGELVGFLALKLDERRLDQLFVAPEHKGSGIGARLFALAKETMPGLCIADGGRQHRGAALLREAWNATRSAGAPPSAWT
jgi:GNAT superfamily N-acetyltransferase